MNAAWTVYFLRVSCFSETGLSSVTGILSSRSSWQEGLFSSTNVKGLCLLMVEDDNIAFIIPILVSFAS